MNREEFSNDVKRRPTFTNWRKLGKVIFFVHPKSKIGSRITIPLRKIVVNEDGVEEIRGVRRFFEGDKDISKQFLLWLENDADEIGLDDVVLRLETAGGVKEEFTKGELLGRDGYDWRKRLLRPRKEYLFDIVNVTDKDDPPTGSEVLLLPFSAGKKLNKVWDDEVEELGSEDGDPWITPYACKVTFDDKERGTDMYSASTVKRPLTPEVEEVFKEAPIDLKQYTDPDLAKGSDSETTLELLRKMCVVKCPLLDTDVEEEEVEESPPHVPKPKKKTTKRKKKPQQQPKQKEDLPKTVSKKPSVPQKPNFVRVEEAEPGKLYVYDDEKVEFVKWDSTKERGIAKDEDGLRVKIPAGEDLLLVEEKSESSCVTDCVKGKSYFTQDGDLLKFVRYNHTKEKGVFSDKDGERVFLNGDEIVSLDANEEDPLEPIAKKEPVEQTKPKKKDESDLVQCPAPDCGEMIPADSDSCPHCAAEFEDEEEFDEDEVPF